MPVVLRSELTKAYSDPVVGPPDIRAWIPELHSSSKCERAFKKGRQVDLERITEPLWCEFCSTDDPQQATIRRNENGTWQPVDVVS